MSSRVERELRQSDARLQHRAREPGFMSTLCQAARILQLIYSSQPSSCGVPPHATDVEHRGICLRSPVPVTPVPGLTPALPTEHLRRHPPPAPGRRSCLCQARPALPAGRKVSRIKGVFQIARLQTAFKAADTNGPPLPRRGHPCADITADSSHTGKEPLLKSGALGLHPGFAVRPSSQASETPSVKSGSCLSQSLKLYSTSNTWRLEGSLWGICSCRTMSRVSTRSPFLPFLFVAHRASISCGLKTQRGESLRREEEGLGAVGLSLCPSLRPKRPQASDQNDHQRLWVRPPVDTRQILASNSPVPAYMRSLVSSALGGTDSQRQRLFKDHQLAQHPPSPPSPTLTPTSGMGAHCCLSQRVRLGQT